MRTAVVKQARANAGRTEGIVVSLIVQNRRTFLLWTLQPFRLPPPGVPEGLCWSRQVVLTPAGLRNARSSSKAVGRQGLKSPGYSNEVPTGLGLSSDGRVCSDSSRS